MFFPGITQTDESIRRKRRHAIEELYRRKGGGKGGGGGGGGRSTGGSSGRSSSVSVGSGNSRGASSNGYGGGSPTTINSGQFSGRIQGGGNRDQVYGNSYYGSGYPAGGAASRGVGGAGFPFFFYPIAWGGVGYYGYGAYMHNDEYGRFDNPDRPGGSMHVAQLNSTANARSTFRLVADKDSVDSLVQDIRDNCRDSNLLLENDAISTFSYSDNDSRSPRAESTLQYYRASSVALTLDGYNNTNAFAEDQNLSPTAQPEYLDRTLLDCLNSTIADNVPLVDNGARSGVPQSVQGLGGLFLILCWLVL